MSEVLRYLLLGPVEVVAGERRVPVDRPRQRAVLAYLLLHANRLVTTDALVEAVWGGSEPGTARTQVQTDLSIVRRVLRDAAGSDPVTTRSSGYVIACEPGQVDVDEFARRSREALALTDPERSIAALREALGLWRGQALAGLNAAYVESVRGTLEEQRLYAYERLFALELECGRAVGIVAELTALVDAHPTHERLVGQLMLALYRSGRQAEALEAARTLRQRLADELGIDPGSDVRELEQAILRNEQAVAAAATPAPVPAQLPPDIADFIGRADDRARLDALVPTAGATTPVVAAIFGPAGVGKTALAVHWGHSVADRFPDGQLYVDLRGYSADQPTTPAEALTRFLRALGMPVDQMPHDLDDLAAAYRTRLAGRSVLIVADNAGHVDQVRPLLPAAPGCLLLVTSRSQLAGLVAVNAARPVILDVLHQRDAEALLARLIGPSRTEAEPEAVVELTVACGHLPLALRIAAAHLVLDAQQRVADLVTRMAPGGRLATLSIAGDRQASVRNAFDNSYEALSADLRTTFRLLGLAPGVDISVAGAAALLGSDDDTARARLLGLAARHLVDHPGEDRYALHDLLREYAATMASIQDSQPDRDAAIDRLLAWQVRNADAANSMLSQLHVRLEIPDQITAREVGFGDRTQALIWLNHERANLMATIRFAADTGRGMVAWLLADILRGYFRRGGHLTEWIEVGSRAADSARHAPHDIRFRAEAITQFGLGLAYQTVGRTTDALARYTAAAEAAERAGWPELEASAIGGLGSVAFRLGQLTDAAAYLRRAVELARVCGAVAVEANSLGNLALVTELLGHIDEARGMLDAVIPLFRKVGVVSGEAQAANNLTNLNFTLGRLDDAAESGRRAVALFEEIGDASLASALSNLAQVVCAQGDTEEALALAQRAREIALTTEHRYLESDAELGLAIVYARIGRSDVAMAHAERALQVAYELDSPSHIMPARTTLAEMLLAAGQVDEAREQGLAALALARERSNRAQEMPILAVLAETGLAAAALAASAGNSTSAAGARQAALGYAAEAIARADALGMRPILDRAHAVLAALRA